MFANQVVEVSESTNDDARKLAEAGSPHGTWVSAQSQSAGRGRLGREWKSLEGNLFLSIVLRPTSAEARSVWSWVPLATAVAVAEAVRNLHPDLLLEIKWPNDLLLQSSSGPAKTGGILCDAVWSRENSFIIAGIGLNCAQAPENLDQLSTCLSAVVPGFDADRVRLPIVKSVLATLGKLMDEGAALLAVRYAQLAALAPGDSVEWSSGVEGAATTPGEVLGLGEQGELRVKDASGREHRLFAEEVRIRAARSKASSARP